MKSMTSYGFKVVTTDSFVLSVEIKSYNNRYLDIIHYVPPSFSVFEAEIDKKIKSVFVRGHVDVNIKYKAIKSDTLINVNEDLLNQYSKALDQIESITGRKAVLNFTDLSTITGLISEISTFDAEFYREALHEALDEALRQCEVCKLTEGEATKKDLLRLLDDFNNSFAVVKANAKNLESTIKQNLLARFDELLGDKGYDETRFLQEVATLLVKFSINEEISRLTAHIEEAYRLINGDEPCAKKLDFLSQEMNRETNTIGSKNIMVEISQMVVVMKDSLENIREQIRNIE